MARVPMRKEITGSRLLKKYASWINCIGCNKTVAYLCYITYEAFDFTYTCTCGSKGEVHIALDEAQNVKASDTPLVTIKNRLCAPSNKSSLMTFVDRNLGNHNSTIVCKSCNTEYSNSKKRISL